MDRRSFVKASLLGGAAAVTACNGETPLEVPPPPIDDYVPPEPNGPPSQVALVKSSDRRFGVRRTLELLDVSPISELDVFLKPNFNTADPPPASTHNDTLEELVVQLYDRGAHSITLGERTSGDTGLIFDQKGIGEIAERLGFDIKNYDIFSPDSDSWVHFDDPELQWRDGLFVPAALREADFIVSTCCVKTHFLATFTMSLKLAVGLLPHDLMGELHYGGRNLNTLVAEINMAYTPDLIVMDGVSVFTAGGPSEGTVKYPNVMVAGTDRIAVDAVGVAILKSEGSDAVRGRIFEQEQIRRAAQLNIGISSPSQIEFVTDSDESRDYATALEDILSRG